MGILSPRFGELVDYPFSASSRVGLRLDGSRGGHSRRVADIAAGLTFRLCLSDDAIRYAFAWGLTHDLATWPLSHTGEAGFADSTSTTARRLREMMLVGAHSLPPALSVRTELATAGIDPDVLLSLFDADAGGWKDRDLEILHQIVHSPLTPDTIEGMYRTGRTYGLRVPTPSEFMDVLERDLVDGLRIAPGRSAVTFRFWRAKSRIYSQLINTERTIEFESAWSTAIRDAFPRACLAGSLETDETEVIRRALGYLERPKATLRYKAPLRYEVSTVYKRKKKLASALPLRHASSVFTKVRL